LGHLNAKFVASRHAIPRFLPQTGVFHETFRFLIGFTSHSDPSFKPGWRIQQLFRGSIYSVSAKIHPVNPQPERQRSFRPRTKRNVLSGSASHETLPGLTVWPNDRNFIAHELQFRSPVFKRGNENV